MDNGIFRHMPSRAASLSCYENNGMIRKNSFINYHKVMSVDSIKNDESVNAVRDGSPMNTQGLTIFKPNRLFNFLMESVKSQFKASIKSKQITQSICQENKYQKRPSLVVKKIGKDHNKPKLQRSIKVKKRDLWQSSLQNILNSKKKVIVHRAKQNNIKNLEYQTLNDSEMPDQFSREESKIEVQTDENEDFYLRSQKYIKNRSEQKKKAERLKSESSCSDQWEKHEYPNLHIRGNLFVSKQKKCCSQGVRALSALQIFGTSNLFNKVQHSRVSNKYKSGKMEVNKEAKQGLTFNELMIQMPHRQSIHSRKNNIRRNKRNMGFPLCFENRGISIKN